MANNPKALCYTCYSLLYPGANPLTCEPKDEINNNVDACCAPRRGTRRIKSKKARQNKSVRARHLKKKGSTRYARKAGKKNRKARKTAKKTC